MDRKLCTQILDFKYEQVDVAKVAANQKHLTPKQYHHLSKTLAKYYKMLCWIP